VNTKAYVDSVREGDAVHVALFMRNSDKAEIWAAHNAMPLQALEYSLSCSPLQWTIRLGEEAIGLFGVGEDPGCPDRGSPWLLATDKLEDIQTTFLKQSRDCVAKMKDRYSLLENWVDRRNLTSIKWLEWCGFTIFKPEPFGVEGKPFHRFEMRTV
jgi:hypothetical protein